ncbi:hypothetical protein [Streptomyces sp. NBC_01565]|uniref:hypothetical protein n=1 Tax=unclassified Streptomyces TaxID=2593676 RepID=UPI00224FE0EB|nr:hypothetical protein [Streptomyces sp. NBC_01565]MCX4543045.1 hypothetical protein [Streptomyces sp. NBC_01565]
MAFMKRGLAALVLSGGAALALTPVAAHAEGPEIKGPPITQRVGEIVDHPGSAVRDTKTAVGAAATAVGSTTQATEGSLSGAGPALKSGLPHAPKVG